MVGPWCDDVARAMWHTWSIHVTNRIVCLVFVFCSAGVWRCEQYRIQNTEYGIRGLTLVLRIQDRPYWERVWSVPIHNTEYDTEYGPAPNCTCRRAVAPTRQVKPVRLGTGIVRCIRIPYSVLGSTALSRSHGLARLPYSVFVFRMLYWVTLPVLARVPYSVFVLFCIRILYHETGGFCIGTVTGPLISRSWARQARVKATLLGSVGVVIVS